MAKHKKEMLRLTVPRRHVLVAALAVSNEDSQPIIQRVCFRPADPAKANSGTRKGTLRTVATNGHKLVSMTGGSWEGEWPASGDVLIPPELFPKKRAKGILDTEISVQVFPDGSVNVLDDATAHQAVADVGFLRYPDIDPVFKRYRRYAVAKDPLLLDAAYLEDMGKIGGIFQDAPSGRIHIQLRRRIQKTDGWAAPVFEATADSLGNSRKLDVLIMGLRDAA